MTKVSPPRAAWLRASVLGLAACWFVGCAGLDHPDELSATESALTDPGILANVSNSAAPSGYGNYCSVTDPTNGGWALWAVTSGDSCAQLSRSVGPGSVVRRAGLWSINGNNNVMVRCDGGVLYYGRATGGDAINWVFGLVSAANTSCVFTVSPTRLPSWGMPFGPATITGTSVFGYHLQQLGFATPWNVADYGHVGGDACEVDRTGTQTRACSTGATIGNPWQVPEAAYDWSVARDTPILAVADGVIRASYGRTVPASCGPESQQELFLETQVGQGQYAEHFIAAYHHMDDHPDTTNRSIAAHVASWGGRPMAPIGTTVHKGDVIGYIGSTGCSGGNHLDLMGFRLTNLTGARSYWFAAEPDGYTGVNGWQGVFDPFGWAAPQGVDPLAYKYIGLGPDGDAPSQVTDIGTFSINLWDAEVFNQLPHNGGASW